MRCVSSFFFTALPSPFDAAMTSAASFSAIDFSLRSREYADQPAHRERGPALRTHFDRHLVRGTTDAAALHFDDRLEVRQRLLEDVHARLARAVLDEVHRAVEDPLGSALLALIHQDVDELGDGLAVVARIRQDGALYSALAAAHFLPPLPAAAPAFGFLVPYLERLWLRPLTPEASSVPRTMW